MTNYNDGKWHGWNGGECPLHPETQGEFVFSDGSILRTKTAGEWEWDDVFLPIIAFRVTKEYKEPREFWVAPFADSYIPANKDHPGAFLVREVLE